MNDIVYFCIVVVGVVSIFSILMKSVCNIKQLTNTKEKETAEDAAWIHTTEIIRRADANKLSGFHQFKYPSARLNENIVRMVIAGVRRESKRRLIVREIKSIKYSKCLHIIITKDYKNG